MTDFQIWDKALPDEQLLKVTIIRFFHHLARINVEVSPKLLEPKVTGCKEFPEGNFLSWENTDWFLNSSRGTVENKLASFWLME